MPTLTPGVCRWRVRLTSYGLRALGLAHYWLKLLDDGTFQSITEIAAAEGMDVGRVSRIMRLTQMAPAVSRCDHQLRSALNWRHYADNRWRQFADD